MRGTSADEESAVGADVDVDPKGLAGVWVGMGVVIGHADIVPGTVQPPYGYEFGIETSAVQEKRWTDLRWINVHEHGGPVLPCPNSIVCQDLARSRLARILRTDHKHSRWLGWSTG